MDARFKSEVERAAVVFNHEAIGAWQEQERSAGRPCEERDWFRAHDVFILCKGSGEQFTGFEPKVVRPTSPVSRSFRHARAGTAGGTTKWIGRAT